MKQTKMIFLFLVAFAAMPFFSDAQNYKLAAGLRLGYPTSASLKYFMSETSALEAYVGTRGYSGYRWYNVSGAYLYHKEISGVDGLQYYFGAGASIFFWNFDTIFGERGSTTSIGLQGYAGLDYTFADAPVNITVDWIPTFFLNGFGSGLGGGYGTLGVRYIISE